MIPSVPAANKNSFNSSGKSNDSPYLLDKFPMLDGGWAASTIVLRKGHLNKPIIKARREADNVEVDVYGFKIKPGLAGIHPKSLTSSGDTLEEFADGGAVRCVRCFNQLDGPYAGSGTGHDAQANFSSSQPRIVSTSGDFKSVGVCYGMDFSDPTTAGYNLTNFGNRITQQKSFFIFPVKKSSGGNYYMGLFGGSNSFQYAEVGNFGGQGTTAFFGGYMTASDNLGTGDEAITAFYTDAENSRIHRSGTTIKTGDPGDRVWSSGSSPQYGDYYISSGFGIMLGPIFYNLSNSDISDSKANEITQYIKDLIEI